MSATIEVSCSPVDDGWLCVVTVHEDASTSRHLVSVSPDELGRLAPGAADPADLVERSFHFLLDREPKESILSRFAISVIGRYFPDYERSIRR